MFQGSCAFETIDFRVSPEKSMDIMRTIWKQKSEDPDVKKSLDKQETFHQQEEDEDINTGESCIPLHRKNRRKSM